MVKRKVWKARRSVAAIAVVAKEMQPQLNFLAHHQPAAICAKTPDGGASVVSARGRRFLRRRVRESPVPDARENDEPFIVPKPGLPDALENKVGQLVIRVVCLVVVEAPKGAGIANEVIGSQSRCGRSVDLRVFDGGTQPELVVEVLDRAEAPLPCIGPTDVVVRVNGQR